MDVEGFGRGEVAPLFVACRVPRSAGLTYPGGVPLDGDAVCVGGV